MLLYYFSEVFRSISRSKLAAVISVLSVTLAVLVTALSVSLVVLSDRIDSKLKERVQIDIFLKQDTDQTSISKLSKELKNEEGVSGIHYVSSEEAEKIFLKETGEEFSSVLDVNPLPASFKVNFTRNYVSENNIQNFIKKYEVKDEVDEIIYDYTTVISILNFINSSRLIVFGISVLLILFAVYLVYSTNRLQIQNKMDQVNTMKLVGAKLSTIRIPLYLTGFLFGIAGSAVSFLVIYIFINFIRSVYISFNFQNYFYILTTLIIILGLFFGLAGSIISSRSVTLKIDKLK